MFRKTSCLLVHCHETTNDSPFLAFSYSCSSTVCHPVTHFISTVGHHLPAFYTTPIYPNCSFHPDSFRSFPAQDSQSTHPQANRVPKHRPGYRCDQARGTSEYTGHRCNFFKSLERICPFLRVKAKVLTMTLQKPSMTRTP